jgi:hypothetical protein
MNEQASAKILYQWIFRDKTCDFFIKLDMYVLVLVLGDGQIET